MKVSRASAGINVDKPLQERIARIRETVSLVNLLLSYNVALKQIGPAYTACCIAHDDHNPSMSIFQGDDGVWKWHCHACGAGHDVLDAYKVLTGTDTMQALDALDGGDYEGRKFATITDEPKHKPAERIVTPPPPDTPPPVWSRANYKNDAGEWVSMGEPVGTWCYRTPEGEPWYYEARYEVDGRKEPRCWTWGKRGAQPARWELSFPPKPRPLYGLEQLAEALQVAVFEGPRKAEAARKLLNGTKSIACIGWPGGANGVKHADWSPLAGKPLLLVPDNDAPGLAAMHDVAGRIAAPETHIIDVSEMADGWDCADALADGWDKAQFISWLKEHKREYVAPEPAPEPPEPTPMPEPLPDEAYADVYAEHDIIWSEPLDIFHEFHAPAIRYEQLPQCLADWCMDTAGVVGVDATILALPAIVAAASMIHDGMQIQPERNNTSWRESARLWGAIVGEPSSKKSPAMSRALSIVKKIDVECNEREGKLKYEYSLNEKAHAANEKAYVDRVSKGEKNVPLPVKPEMPEIHRAIAQDFTIEVLRDILKHSARGILAERDELTGFFGSMDQYKNAKGSDRAAWLELYNGGSRRIERVGAGSIFVRNWSACLVGGIQPEPLRAIASGMHEDGLLQRFMVVYGRPGGPGNEQAPNKAADTRYRDMMRQLWDTQPSPNPVHLSIGANEVRKEIVAYAYRLIGIKFVSTAMTAHLGKWEGLSARLMLTFHCIECADRKQHPQSSEVSVETAERVKLFMLNLLLPHATAFYMDVVGGSELTKQVNAVANLILCGESNEITLRDITRGWIGWRHASEQLQNAVLNRLIDAAWLQVSPTARTGKRALATRYLINPTLRDAHTSRIEEERKRRDEAKAIIESIQGSR